MKTVLKFFLKLLFVVCVLYAGLHYFILSGYEFTRLLRMRPFVIELLDIPYRDVKPYDVGMNYGDLEDITYDEWMSMQCEDTNTSSDMYKSYSSIEINAKLRDLGEKAQRHLYCIRPKTWSGENISNIEVSKIDSPALVIVMNEYILKYPKVLNNLIKIAEKPCRYIENLPSREEARKILDKQQREHIEEKIWFKGQIREELFCDTRTKRFTIIRIVDSNNATKYDIVIPRIDLPKKERPWWKRYFD